MGLGGGGGVLVSGFWGRWRGVGWGVFAGWGGGVVLVGFVLWAAVCICVWVFCCFVLLSGGGLVCTFVLFWFVSVSGGVVVFLGAWGAGGCLVGYTVWVFPSGLWLVLRWGGGCCFFFGSVLFLLGARGLGDCREGGGGWDFPFGGVCLGGSGSYWGLGDLLVFLE